MKQILLGLSVIFWVSCQNIQKQEINNSTTDQTEQVNLEENPFQEIGFATWYGIQFQGKSTASGESFDKEGMTASHRSIPFGSVVEVQNLENSKLAKLRINDRGPFQEGVILEVTEKAAKELDFKEDHFAKVGINILEKGDELNKLVKDDTFGVDDEDDDDDDDDVDEESTPPIKKDDKKKPTPSTNTVNPPTKTTPPPVKTTPVKPVVEIPNEVKTTTTSTSSAGQPKGYTVQVGVFKDEKRALDFKDVLKKDFTEKVFLFPRSGNYVVQIGDFTKRDDAVILREKLKASKVPNCFIPPKQ
jgi:rare lipoprotein A